MDYQSLKKIVKHHDKLYYDLGNSVLSDEEYDSLYDQLVAMEKLQGWKDPDSPTVKITSAGGKVKHPYRLYSLQKVYKESDIDSAFSVVTPKLDGVNLSVTYKEKSLALALTRGDGEYGENVNHLASVIKGIPRSIKTEQATFVGEVVTDMMDIENFRNYVAGALGLKSAKDAKDRKLRFIVHDVLGSELDYRDRLKFAEKHGFLTVLSDYDFGQYPQDGTVFRVESAAQEQNLGYTSKHPKFAVALKQKEHFSAATNLRDIVWTVGRSGVVTPVGLVEPVVLDGATVTRVILHNFEFVVDNDLRPGDSILIERRITPQFVKVLEHSKYNPFTLQDVERYLGVAVKRKGPKLFVDTQDGRRLVEYYVKTLGIKGLGPASIEKLDLTHPYELYDNVPWEILGKNGDKIREEISRPKDYPSVLASLGIPGVGKSTAQLICNHIPTFERLADIAHIPIKGIGPSTVENILSWLEVNYEWVEKLPYSLEASTTSDKEEVVETRKVCITGKLDTSKRELGEHLSKFGFQLIDSVSKDCYALITSGEESTKTKKAQKYGIPVINYWNNRAIILKGMF